MDGHCALVDRTAQMRSWGQLAVSRCHSPCWGTTCCQQLAASDGRCRLSCSTWRRPAAGQRWFLVWS